MHTSASRLQLVRKGQLHQREQRLADAGVDVIYVLTGHRMEGGRLDEQATRLLSAYLCLPEHTQRSLATLIETLRQDLEGGGLRTLHSRSQDYRAESAGLR